MTDDYAHGERETDDMIDAWHERLEPMTDAERDAIIRRVSRGIEALDSMAQDAEATPNEQQ